MYSSIEIPKHTFVTVKSPRYRADSLIRFLRENQADSIKYTIGIIEKDISATKRDAFGNIKKPTYKYTDWGIFGLGYRSGASCIVSTYRLKNDKSKFFDRLKKVSIHEIGHNLGLKHCPTKGCVMQDAIESMATIDNETMELCVKCISKIK